MQLETIKRKVTKSSFGAVFYTVPFISSPEFVHLRGHASDSCLYIFSNFIFLYPPWGKKQTTLPTILKKSEKQQVTGLDENRMLHTSTTVTYSLNRSIETITHLSSKRLLK